MDPKYEHAWNPKFKPGDEVSGTDNKGAYFRGHVHKLLGPGPIGDPSCDYKYMIDVGRGRAVYSEEKKMQPVAFASGLTDDKHAWPAEKTVEYSPPIAESTLRKMQPVGTVLTKYFPDAMRAIAAVAWVGNEKHNPGEPLHWARGKSDDHLDCDVRHLINAEDATSSVWDRTSLPDGRVFEVLHAAEHAWRALALLQLQVEKLNGEVIRVIKAEKTST